MLPRTPGSPANSPNADRPKALALPAARHPRPSLSAAVAGPGVGRFEASAKECRRLRARRWAADLDRWQLISPIRSLRRPDRPSLMRSAPDATIDNAEIRASLGDYAGAEQALRSALLPQAGRSRCPVAAGEAPPGTAELALPYAEQPLAPRLPPRKATAHRLAGEINSTSATRPALRAAWSARWSWRATTSGTLRSMVWVKRGESGPAAAYALRARRAADAPPVWQRAAAHRLCARMLLEARRPPGALASRGGRSPSATRRPRRLAAAA